MIKNLMESILDGNVDLSRSQKDRLKIVRDGIRKVVYDGEDLEMVLDKDMVQAIKLILKICKTTFPEWEKEDSSSSSDDKNNSSDDKNVSSDDYDSN